MRTSQFGTFSIFVLIRYEWLDTDWIPGQFGSNWKNVRSRYIDFLRVGTDLPSTWDGLWNQIYLGNEDFIGKAAHQYVKRNGNRQETMARACSMREVDALFGFHCAMVGRAARRYEQIESSKRWGSDRCRDLMPNKA